MRPTSSKLTRRRFLQSTALAGAATLARPRLFVRWGEREAQHRHDRRRRPRRPQPRTHDRRKCRCPCDVNETNLLKAAEASEGETIP